ncbi:hypothetical protein G0U57_006762, partial [Chelydra serpentina]
ALGRQPRALVGSGLGRERQPGAAGGGEQPQPGARLRRPQREPRGRLGPVRAGRGAGQAGDRRAGADLRRGAAGQRPRAAGAAPHGPQGLPRAPLHPPPQPGRPGRGLLPGAAAAVLGGDLPLPRARRAVPRGQAPAGLRHVRLGLPAGGHDGRPLRGRVPPAADPAPARPPPAGHGGGRLGAQPAAQHPAVLHLLPQRGGARLAGLRLLGALRAALGAPRLRHLDHRRHLRGARAGPGHLLRLHLRPPLAQHPRQDPPARGRGRRGAPQAEGGGSGWAPRRRLSPGDSAHPVCQQRQDHLPGQDPHRQDDLRDRLGVRRLLGALLHRPDVVRLGCAVLLDRF